MSVFYGFIVSSDATHVFHHNCSDWAHNIHKSWKSKIPYRNYNIIVNHNRRILHSTNGHPGTYNDQSLQEEDVFLRCVKDGRKYSDLQFELYEMNSDGCVYKKPYKGAWFIVDNGYKEWTCLQPPLKDHLNQNETRYSQWLESMRKDVECTFGMLKKVRHIKNWGEST